MSRPARPKPFAVGSVRVRIHSGPRADGRWRWRADRPAGTKSGREVRTTVWSGWATRDEAEKLLIKLLRADGEGAGKWQPDEDIRRVEDLLNVWVADVEPGDKSPCTSAARRGCSERLIAAMADVQLERLGRPALERYARTYQGAASTLRQDLRALGAAWAWARERGLVPDRALPALRIRADGGRYSRYTPTVDEVAAVIEVLRDRSGWAWRACYLLWATGCRPAEIAALTWADVRGGSVTVRGKTGSRTIPLHPTVWAEVSSWPRGPQLSARGYPTTSANPDSVCGCRPATVRGRLHDWLAEACSDLELPRWSPYGLRRAAVARLYRAGEDPSVAAAVLGHSPAVALRHYRQVAHEDLAAAVQRAGLGLLPERKDNVESIDEARKRRR